MSQAYIFGEKSISVYYNGENYSVSNTHPSVPKIRQLIIDGDMEEAVRQMNLANSVSNWAHGKITIVDNQLMYEDEVLAGPLANRVVSMFREGFDVTPMVKFIENLRANPSYTAIKELYLFLEKGSLPITDDGYFLAYKKVNDNYRDFYSGKFDNSIGAVCEVPRSSVDDNRNRTCSYGLHFCSLDYLCHYAGGQGRVMIVKINPADVVAIPSDYNNTKGRCSRYEVVAEHTCTDREKREYFGASVYSADNDWETPEVGYDEAQEEAYEDWWDEDEDSNMAYDRGYEDGRTDGYEDGYQDGLMDK